MKTFRLFRVMKSFHAWKKLTRHRKYAEKRKQFSSSFFWAKPVFCSPLLEIKRLMTEISHVQCVEGRKLNSGIPAAYKRDEYVEVQIKKREASMKQVDQLGFKIATLVERVCK